METSIKTRPTNTISVIMAAYNASKTVGVTIQNLLDQSYKSIEIIIVDDGSTDETASVVKSYQKKYNNVKLVSLKENSGPFKARVAGVDYASGEYIHFIDADDYLSVDFYRTTLTKATETHADIVIGSIVLDFKNQGYIRDYPLINDLPFTSLSGSDIFKAFMEQGGLNFIYHMNSTKLYSKRIWDKSRPYYDWIEKHLIMADDVAMNIPLWYFAQKIERTPTATLFYVKDDNDSATSNYQISSKKMLKNIADLNTVFTFFEKFLSERKDLPLYEGQLSNWKRAFTRVYHRNISEAGFEESERDILLEELFSNVAPYSEKEHWLDTPFFHIHNLWRGGLEDIKKALLRPEVTSVIFSTDSLFNEEVRFNGKSAYSVRKTGLELAQLAHFLKKPIYINSSSSAISTTLKSSPFSLFNILEAKSANYGVGAMSVALPKPLDIFLERGLNQPFHYIYENSKKDTMASVITGIANLCFDNPYITTFEASAFNGRPSLLGLYSLGLHQIISSYETPAKKGAYNNLLKIIFEDEPLTSPYEVVLAKGIHSGINQFVSHMQTINSKDLTPLISTKKNSQAAIGLAFHTRVWVDRQLLKPLLYKYPQIIDTYEASAPGIFSVEDHLHNALTGKSKVIKFTSYILINPGLALGAIKKRVNYATKKSPTLNRLLKNIYQKIKRTK